jgi:peptidoglycan/xylan/chitin deacetylase (PgdA/CDA1 family)
LKQTIIRTGLETLYFSGLYHVMRPLLAGVGCILTFHHVRPPRPDCFQPNRLLEVTPVFFEDLLRLLKRQNIDVISLDEMHRRLITEDFKRRFVCITFDDGYKDVLQWAYPLLKKYEMPFAMFIATSFPDRIGELWWLGLEAVIAQNSRISLSINGEMRLFDCAHISGKREVFSALNGYLWSMKRDGEIRQIVRDLCARYNVDMAAFCRELCMNWEEISRMAEDPLCTIGAHTVNHPMLRKLADDSAVRAEMEQSRAALNAALGRWPEHLAYPGGTATAAGAREFRLAAELGFKTGLTTRPGVLFKAHRDHFTALPRLSVNGEFQQQRYLEVLMSGAGSAIWNGFRRVNAA